MSDKELRKPTVYAFVDASNVWEVQKAKGKFFEYRKIISYLLEHFGAETVRVFYYTAYPENGTREYSLSGKHDFFTYLEKGLGFTVRKKPLKRIAIGNGMVQEIREKGNMDVEMTIDAVHQRAGYDIAAFFTGDSDFLALVNYLRNGGREVHVFSSKNSVSRELRTGGDGYLDLLRIETDIWGRQLIRRAGTGGQKSQ